jgi:hypothetical protein
VYVFVVAFACMNNSTTGVWKKKKENSIQMCELRYDY